eukprot:scaffold15_cov354-Prasinococcus_capsulatus_cf.AAC.5
MPALPGEPGGADQAGQGPRSRRRAASVIDGQLHLPMQAAGAAAGCRYRPELHRFARSRASARPCC